VLVARLMEWLLLAALTEEDRRDLLSRSRRRRFAKGRVTVRLTTPLGDATTLRIIGAGGWFGELALLCPAPRNATIVALPPVETLLLHRDQVADIRRRVPAFEHVVDQALVAEVRRLSKALLEALFVAADKRILRRLADLVAIRPRRGPGCHPADPGGGRPICRYDTADRQQSASSR